MTPSEALTVKPGDILTAIFETARYKKGEEFTVGYLNRFSSGVMHDTGAVLISLRTANSVNTNIQDFVFADITKSWRTSEVWKDYICIKEIPSVDIMLEYISGLHNKIKNTKSAFEKDFYQNEIEASKVMLDILNGTRDKYGIQLCTTL